MPETGETTLPENQVKHVNNKTFRELLLRQTPTTQLSIVFQLRCLTSSLNVPLPISITLRFPMTSHFIFKQLVTRVRVLLLEATFLLTKILNTQYNTLLK